MKDEQLNKIRDLIQEDVGKRGLQSDPERNLINLLPDDFRTACQSIAETPKAKLGIVTGFYIPGAEPDPVGETDGPLGAVYLARALAPLGIEVTLLTDAFCAKALAAGLAACSMQKKVNVLVLPAWDKALAIGHQAYYSAIIGKLPGLTHLISLERPGPSHALSSIQIQLQGQGAQAMLDFLQEVPTEAQGRCQTMRGIDITEKLSPAHWLFEFGFVDPSFTTIGIGDGGNEIGMGKIPWDVLRKNIPNGGRIGCRLPTQLLIVAGISNWGAYGLAAGVWLLKGKKLHPLLADPANERKILKLMVEKGPLVDGVTGKPTLSVDGLEFDHYAAILGKLAAIS